MAEELEVGEFWLPPELLEDSFAFEKDELQPGEAPVEVAVGMERDGEEEDYMDGLTRRMTQSFLQEDKEEAKREAAWPSPWEQWKGDEWTLFQETGGWVAASDKLNWGPRRQCPAKNSVPSRCFAAPLDAHYPWDANASRVFQLRQQQFAAAWERQTVTGRGRAGGRGAPPRQLQHQHRPAAGMRAVFLRRSGERKEPVGTGVFLPRTATRNTERKNNSDPDAAVCPTVLIPAKVAQALNLNVENFPSGFVLQHDAFVERRKEALATAVAISSGLPQEWTY